MTEQNNLTDVIGWVKTHNYSLQLTTDRLAFLVALEWWADEQFLPELTEAQLHDAFSLVSRQFNQLDETLVERANNAINDLTRQRLLNRFTFNDGEDSVYRLSPLGISLARSYQDEQAFSRVRLSLQLAHVGQAIEQAYTSAQLASSDEQWQTQVYAVLRYTVADALSRIDFSQRSMDAQQGSIKDDIANLLHRNWKDAIGIAERLLKETGESLKELQQTLHAASAQLQAGLLNIQELVQHDPERDGIAMLCQRLQLQLDSIISWSQQSIDLWTRYDKHVHRFIRTAIDMDKNRAFAQRLRESIVNFPNAPWCLTLTQEVRLLELRDETMAVDAAEVTGDLPAELEYQDAASLRIELAEDIKAALHAHQQQGTPMDLATVLGQFLARYDRTVHFDMSRIIIDEALRLGYADSELFSATQAPWLSITDYGAKVKAHVIDRY